jgi:hypothetical protein
MKRKIASFALLLIVLTATGQPAFSQKASVASETETQVLYLSGHGSDDAVLWDFQCTEGLNSGKWAKIAVPSCWETQGFGTAQYGMPFYGKENPPGVAKEQGMYKYTFQLPAAWQGRTIRLVFDGVMTECTATINQRKAVKLHQGSFYRFKADVSDRVFFGKKENVLEVTVSKESANSSVNMAERRADYWNFGGIFRPVFIEALPVRNIERISMDAKADGSLTVQAFLGLAMEKDAVLEAQLQDLSGKDLGRPIVTDIRPGSNTVQFSTVCPNVKNWSAETPNRYQMRFTLKAGNAVKHTCTERFAFRTIQVRPSDGLYINGSKVLIKGVNRHSFRPETGRTLCYKANLEDAKLIKELNMNAVRLSHYPSDPEFLDICDSLGLYVMVELDSWHKHYDTALGKQLVMEMVTRDANHPSVIWWSNGNEGGWNTELDAEFATWDLQKRPLIHPQGNFGGFETMHYRSYGESQEYMRKPEIFMPTEFLHGMYDGGIGAGLNDYWEMMRNHPRCAGGFLWVFADEGLKRRDQDGRIDCVGSYAPDGIVGPHFEKEGSFYTVKEIWSPVQVMEKTLPEDFKGTLTVENRYDFNHLNRCRFEWQLVRFADASEAKAGHAVLASGKTQAPDLAPHTSGKLSLNLPSGLADADALQLTAVDPDGESLFTWSWALTKTDFYRGRKAQEAGLKCEKTDTFYTVSTGSLRLKFNVQTGELAEVMRGNKKLSFSNGPRFVAFRRSDRSMDVFYNHDDEVAKTKERLYTDISGTSKLTHFSAVETKGSITVTADYFGNMTKAVWTITSDGKVALDYEYRYDGVVELMGIQFDYPESQMQSKRWLGNGPYRVWQNRLQGPTLDVWQNNYNDPIPGESFLYPEFKGFFSQWRWVEFGTSEGTFRMGNQTPNSYLGVYKPKDGRDAQLYTFPEMGIAVLDVIPAVRNKVNSTDLNGPSAQAHWANGPQKGRIEFDF